MSVVVIRMRSDRQKVCASWAGKFPLQALSRSRTTGCRNCNGGAGVDWSFESPDTSRLPVRDISNRRVMLVARLTFSKP